MFTFPFFIITFQILVCPQIWACISFVPENLVWLQFKDNLSSFFWHYSQIGTVTIQTTFFLPTMVIPSLKERPWDKPNRPQ
jgi:hypothetical protein